MKRGDTQTVTAAVTLSRRVAPERVLNSVSAAASPAIVVSCIIDARLRASRYAFTVDNQTWQQRSFLTMNTARWTWYVGPKIGGNQTLLLDMRPIVKVRYASGRDSFASAEDANIQTYAIKVHVDVPWTERPAELMSRLADTFKVAQGLIEAMTGVLTALVALAAALGIKRARSKGAGPSDGNAEALP